MPGAGCEFGACGSVVFNATNTNLEAASSPILVATNWGFDALHVVGLFKTATHNAFHAPPEKVNSGVCSIYGSQPYMGASLQCVCKTAGESAWSQDTRGCLAADQNAGVPEFIGHGTCTPDRLSGQIAFQRSRYQNGI